MKPIRLFLKHFKGLKAGAGVNEISLDLASLPLGLIAITGTNGMGKTTILDNLHPYRLMPYKLREAKEWTANSFSYYDHTFGEATKELIFEHGGVRYKSLILIDADKKKQEAYLYQEVGETWTPLNDGKTRTYDAAVESVVGSPALFFSSVFRAQDARKLSSYPRSEILNIVCELLNIDHIKQQGEKARAVANGLAQDIQAIQGESDTLTVFVTTTTDRVNEELADNAILLANIERDIETYKGRVAELQQQRKDAEIAQAAQAEAQKRLDVLLDRKRELEADLASVTADEITKAKDVHETLDRTNEQISATHRMLFDSQDKLSAIQREIDDIRLETDGLNAKVEAANAKVEELQAASKDAIALVDAKREEAEFCRAKAAEAKTMAATLSGMGRQLSDLEARAKMLDTLDCKAEGTGWINDACPLLKDAVDARSRITILKEEFAELTAKMEPLENAEADLTRIVAEGRNLKVASDNITVELDKAIAGVKALHALSIKAERLAALEEQVPALTVMIENAGTRKEELDSQQGELTVKLDTIKTAAAVSRGEVRAKIAEVDQQVVEAQQAAAGSTVDLGMLADTEAVIQRDINNREISKQVLTEKNGELKAELAKVATSNDRIAELAGQLTAIRNETANWVLIAQACSNDGIIALEIDDAGPTIAGIANDLLTACYGPRFSVRLETQSMKADGGLKETFDITVFDAERDEVKSIKDMSGGEVCWIDDAISRAISHYNAQQARCQYGTLFTDEKDGALDANRKTEFLAIKRRAMEVGTHSREFFISQTLELVEMADARIVVAPGGVAIA